MPLHRELAHDEPFGDLRVAQPLCHQAEHVQLARAEPSRPRWLSGGLALSECLVDQRADASRIPGGTEFLEHAAGPVELRARCLGPVQGEQRAREVDTRARRFVVGPGAREEPDRVFERGAGDLMLVVCRRDQSLRDAGACPEWVRPDNGGELLDVLQGAEVRSPAERELGPEQKLAAERPIGLVGPRRLLQEPSGVVPRRLCLAAIEGDGGPHQTAVGMPVDAPE